MLFVPKFNLPQMYQNEIQIFMASTLTVSFRVNFDENSDYVGI
jgi:hypothetical protein